jgi:hypothetical protein
MFSVPLREFLDPFWLLYRFESKFSTGFWGSKWLTVAEISVDLGGFWGSVKLANFIFGNP